LEDAQNIAKTGVSVNGGIDKKRAQPLTAAATF